MSTDRRPSVASTRALPPSLPRPPAPVWWRQLLAIKETLIIILTPILFLPLPLAAQSRAANCAYVIIIMAIYWMTEALPMAVTALMPIAVMPWLDVSSSKKLAMNYLKDANFLFFGGLLIAVAVEKWGLHKRVALRVLMLVGSKPVWILFGFMSVTGFLSMWLSNTACAAMMIPIAVAVLKELDEHRKSQRVKPQSSADADDAEGKTGVELQLMDKNGRKMSTASSRSRNKKTDDEEKTVFLSAEEAADEALRYAAEDSEFRLFACALKLSVAYASNVGGTGTMIGCGPNIVLKGMVDSIYGPNNGLDFTSYFVLAFPDMILNLAISWLSLVIIFIGPRKAFGRQEATEAEKAAEESANALIQREYKKLGRMTFAEASVLACFVTLALLWLTKSPGIFPGWLSLLPRHKEGAYVTDSSVAISICVLLFILPSRMPNYLCFRKYSTDLGSVGPSPPLLDWPTVHKQMPWSVIILLGGGFALADACQDSGLSTAIGNFLVSFKVLPPWIVVLLMVVVATVVTTFTSNVSTTTILLPITAQLANSIQINPLYMMIPVTIAASFSYVLPVSTPPNAIVYAYGDITMLDMIKTGVLNCALHIIILQVAVNSWGSLFFRFGVYPDWAPQVGGGAGNGTVSMMNSTLSAMSPMVLESTMSSTVSTLSSMVVGSTSTMSSTVSALASMVVENITMITVEP